MCIYIYIYTDITINNIITICMLIIIHSLINKDINNNNVWIDIITAEPLWWPDPKLHTSHSDPMWIPYGSHPISLK